MSQLKSLTVLAVAAAGLLVAGCSSSSSPSTTAAAATTPATTPAASSPAASPTMVTSSPAGAGKVSAADCEIIGSVSASAISKLTVLSTEPKSKTAATMKAYLSELEKDDTFVTSAAGKKVLGTYISTLEKTTSEPASEATAQMTTELGVLGSACS
jgi:hypothetical protein